MKILGIDTSTLTAGIALLDGERLIERRERVTTHSERLLPNIDEVMREAALAAKDLDAIACAAGPGSFTGLRIGLATAKGLCFATGKPLVMISSLQTLARRAPPETTVCATIDAFKGEVYAGLFRGGILQGEEQVLPPDALLEQLAERPDVAMIGEGALRYPWLAARRTLIDDDPSPRPGDLVGLALEAMKRGEIANLADAGPRYIRLSEPELLKMKRDKLKP